MASEVANAVDLEAAPQASEEMTKNSVDIPSEVEVPWLEVALTYLLEEEAIDHPSRELEADSRVPPEVNSEAAPAVLALASMTEKTESLFLLENNLMKRAEVSNSKDHSEDVVVSEAATSLIEVAEECTLEEVAKVVVLKEMKREVLEEEVPAPAQLPL